MRRLARMTACQTISFALLTLLAGTAHAQSKLKIMPGPDRPLENLVPIVAPLARSLVISETHGLIAVGHHPKHTANISLYKIDAAGAVQGEPTAIQLTVPASLARMPVTPAGICFHPTKPLLYVWQDVVLPRTPTNEFAPLQPAEVAGLNEIDHLLIFKLEPAPAPPRLLVAMCRGLAFGHGRPQGSVCVDAPGERLYIPNLRGDMKNLKVMGCICGSYVLDAVGMPVIGKTPVDGVAGPATGAATTAEASAQAITAALQAGQPVMPQRITPYDGWLASDLPESATGIGFIPLGRDFVLFGGYHDMALATWAPDDRRVRLHMFMPHGYGYRHHIPAIHPTLPMIYIVAHGVPQMYRLEHVDGYPTLVPQSVEFVGANLYTGPIVMARHKLLALGSHSRILLVPLDDTGRLKKERSQVLVANHYIEALAYSEKFDRLYVGTVAPEKPK